MSMKRKKNQNKERKINYRNNEFSAITIMLAVLKTCSVTLRNT